MNPLTLHNHKFISLSHFSQKNDLKNYKFAKQVKKKSHFILMKIFFKFIIFCCQFVKNLLTCGRSCQSNPIYGVAPRPQTSKKRDSCQSVNDFCQELSNI